MQIIELRRESTEKDKPIKATLKYAGVAKFNNKPVQSTEDMLRVAKKINMKLKNSLIEIEKEIQRAMELSRQKKNGKFELMRM